MLTLSKLHEIQTCLIDFTFAFPQDDVKTTIFVCDPPGVELNIDKNKYALNLSKNVYGLKDAECTWWEHLTTNLGELGFKHSEVVTYIFTSDRYIVICYVDNCLMCFLRKALATLLQNLLLQTKHQKRQGLNLTLE